MSLSMITEGTEQAIKNHLEYRNGKLFWKNRSGFQAHLNGKQAGGYDKNGYLRLRVNGTLMFAHRVIYFLHYACWPRQIDHKNRIKDDNRIENLRACTASENRTNVVDKINQSIYGRNVSKKSNTGKYRVRLTKFGKEIQIGRFEDLEFAQLVASEARKKYYGDFA